LRIAHSAPLTLTREDQRFIDVLSYYAALGAERVRLVAEAERAEALRRADQLKDALLASVSHDLRTPLTTIKALAQGMRAEGDERAAIIEEESDRLNRFVADLLDLSRVAAGALHVRPELNAAEDLVGAALQRVGGALNGRVLTTHVDPNAALLLGRFDFVHSLRILVNVIENALKYSPSDCEIDVSAQRAGDWLEFVVADRGLGVPPSERERIFEPFYRPGGTPPDSGGAGLGLSIARRLALVQNGALEYEPREGGGSRFILRLPYAELEQDTAVEAPESL
jgi:two-component system sensor histidine kinase KdpD